MSACAVLAVLAAGCGDQPSDVAGTDAGAELDAASAGDGGALTDDLWRPVAPSAERFAWQGVQNELYRASDGRNCRDAEVVIGIGSEALCFVDADDELRCAGRVYDREFGSTFELVGQTGVDQIFISMVSGTVGGNSLCVHRRDGTAWCLGAFNNFGQYNDGTTNPTSDWVRWGSRDELVSLATGTFDQFCGRYADGSVECVGNQFGVEPVAVGTSALERMWIDTYGDVHLDDLEVFRVSNGRTDCQVMAHGLACAGLHDFGDAGKVVDGNWAGMTWVQDFEIDTVCWLDDVGRVFCGYREEHPDLGVLEPVRVFLRGPVVALALDGYGFGGWGVSSARCAVRHDGSLWCVGDNTAGKLGTGDEEPLLEETEVQPPGTVRIRCDEPGGSG